MKMKIFLSAVSGQFRACRDALRSDLSAVGAEVVVQEDFQQHGGSLLEKLEGYIASCDRIIALVGDAYGFEPDEIARPANRSRRSYTQWEYFFALGERLDGTRQPHKDIFLYFASPEFLAMHAVKQTNDAAELQAEFIQTLQRSGKDWNQFSALHELRALVLRDGFRLRDRVPQPGNLPYTSLGRLFKGREHVLSELLDRLQQNPGRALVIHAQAGVGKTRLTIEYALRHEAAYSALLMVGADSPEALKRNLAALCGAQVLNLPEREAKEQEVKVAGALRWLDEHHGWLLILDKADTREAAEAVEALLPRLQAGHVVVTSRLSDWSSSVESLELDFLGADAAVEFLLERTKNRRAADASDDDKARELAQELDGLALALEQAGAFISQMRCSFSDYLQRRHAREEKVRAWHDARLMHYPFSMAVTWDTTFEQLDGPGRALLNFLCWLAPEPVPRALLSGMKLQRSKHNAAEGTPAEDVDIEDALASLAGFSMLKWETGNQAFRIHGLILEAIRERLPEEDRKGILQGMMFLVDNYLPGDPPPNDVRSWPLWETMAAHVVDLISQAIDAHIGHPTSRLASMLGMFLAEKGVWPEAESLARLALTIDEQVLGPEHPTVAIRLNNLAQRLQDTNRVPEAETLLRRALAIEEKSGQDPARMALRLHNLASLLVRAKRVTEAEPLIRRALTIDEQTVGREHANFARDLNLLTGLLVAMNRHAEVEPLMRSALATDENIFGLEHPHVARDLYNLAAVLWDLNRLAEAEPLLRRALEILEKNYEPKQQYVVFVRKELEQLLQDIKRQ
jgi:tetratricopeptide (TPR) repeat protein